MFSIFQNLNFSQVRSHNESHKQSKPKFNELRDGEAQMFRGHSYRSSDGWQALTDLEEARLPVSQMKQTTGITDEAEVPRTSWAGDQAQAKNRTNHHDPPGNTIHGSN